jgi:U3 small nucleolar RNA-associated protein 21
MSGRSELFQAYRAIGFVTDGNPFHIKQLGKENFLTVSIGKAWQVYKVGDKG